jgi:hypothetical protein
MKYAHGPNDIPKEPHYAILRFGTIYIEADERSKTHPGHGYPASTETKIDYMFTLDRAEWEIEITRLETPKYGGRESYRALWVGKVPVIKLETKVSL